MGHQVVYCDKCGRMLREDDFLRGKAHTVENRSYCVECRPPEPAPKPAPLPASTPRSFRTISTTRIPQHATPSASEVLSSSSGAPSKKPLFIGIAVTTVVLIIAAVALTSGGKGNRGEVDVAVSVTHPAPPRHVDPTPGPAPTLPPAPATSVVEEPARRAYLKALDLKKVDPNNLSALQRALDEVVNKFPTAGVTEEARREIKEIERRCADEIGQLYSQAATPLAAEDFRAVLEFWQKARSKYDVAGWTSAVDDKIREANDLAASRFPAIRARAADSKKINAAEEVAKYRERIVKWGLPKYVEEFDKTLAEVTPDKPEGIPAATTKEGAAYLAAWREAMDLAARREYEAAAQALQKGSAGLKEDAVKANAAADAEALKLAAAAYAEGKALFAKVAKGQKLTLVYTDDTGARASVEGTVSCTDAHRLEVRRGEEIFVVLAGEVGAATLGDLYRNRPGRKPEDARAAALLCLIEGDLDSARKSGVDTPLPDRYVALAGEVDAARRNPEASAKELEARKLCSQAEAGFLAPARTLEAIKIYKSLLADFAGTAFVKRNKGAFSTRTDGGKEHVLAAADLSGSNNFRLGKFNNVECWMSAKDVEAASFKENYVQIDFSAHPDLEYHLWVQVGGCCQEVLAVHVQGTELQAPNPKKMGEMIAVPVGGDAIGAVRMPSSSLKRKHSDHTGPKEPDRWEWVPIPLQKYPMAGTKSVRLLTTQKGFSVAAAVVSALKPGPPKDADLKEAERAKAEIPGYAYYRSLSETGGILREWWTGIPGTAIADLRNNPAFPDKPAGSAVEKSFTAPVDWADNYGTRMRGWVHPPVTGNYVFWIASDDQGELWLGADDKAEPKTLQKIASVPDYTSPNEWTKYASQQSQPVPLVAGRRYYIEALQKEGGGGDHLSVKWKLPDGTEEAPIPGNRLSPWGGKKK